MSTFIPTPDDLTLDEVMSRFYDDDVAREYLEYIRWPDGVICPHCKNAEQDKMWKIAENKERKIRAGLRQCGECKKQFTVTVGTVFEDSHIPLRKWLVAWYLLCSSKKGISALQIQRMLGFGSYRTAHFLMHRIRHALRDPIFKKKLGGTVEVDETYIGGKPRSYKKDGRTLSKVSKKMAVVSLVERGGTKRSMVVNIAGKELREAVYKHVAPNTAVCTDENNSYTFPRDKKYFHHTVTHGRKEYARKVNSKFTAHNNTAESSFALLKRGVIGTFHSISRQHLPLYLAEFDYRWNEKDTTDGARTVKGIKKAEGKRLKYKTKKKSR